MNIHRISPVNDATAERRDNGRADNQRFKVDPADTVGDDGAAAERVRDARGKLERRRFGARLAARRSEAHRRAEGAAEAPLEEASRSEFDPFADLLFGHGEEQEGGEGEAGGGGGEGAMDEPDFALLQQQLTQLRDRSRITLFLPSLGRVTAQLLGGAMHIDIEVPQELIQRAERGLAGLRERLEAIGVQVAAIELRSLPPLRCDTAAVAASHGDALGTGRSLVDVLV